MVSVGGQQARGRVTPTAPSSSSGSAPGEKGCSAGRPHLCPVPGGGACYLSVEAGVPRSTHRRAAGPLSPTARNQLRGEPQGTERGVGLPPPPGHDQDLAEQRPVGRSTVLPGCAASDSVSALEPAAGPPPRGGRAFPHGPHSTPEPARRYVCPRELRRPCAQRPPSGSPRFWAEAVCPGDHQHPAATSGGPAHHTQPCRTRASDETPQGAAVGPSLGPSVQAGSSGPQCLWHPGTHPPPTVPKPQAPHESPGVHGRAGRRRPASPRPQRGLAQGEHPDTAGTPSAVGGEVGRGKACLQVVGALLTAAGEVTLSFCFSPSPAQARITSWPKENPGSWFSEFKRGKLVRLPLASRSRPSHASVPCLTE